jgi:hypothetical protein
MPTSNHQAHRRLALGSEADGDTRLSSFPRAVVRHFGFLSIKAPAIASICV